MWLPSVNEKDPATCNGPLKPCGLPPFQQGSTVAVHLAWFTKQFVSLRNLTVVTLSSHPTPSLSLHDMFMLLPVLQEHPHPHLYHPQQIQPCPRGQTLKMKNPAFAGYFKVPSMGFMKLTDFPFSLTYTWSLLVMEVLEYLLVTKGPTRESRPTNKSYP